MIAVGSGQPGSDVFFSWGDSDPIPDISHVGLSAWDKHVAYRNISMHAAVRILNQPQLGTGEVLSKQMNVSSLFDICASHVASSLAVHNVCAALDVAELLSPALQSLKETALTYLAEHLEEVYDRETPSFVGLSATCLREMLTHGSLVGALPTHLKVLICSIY